MSTTHCYACGTMTVGSTAMSRARRSHPGGRTDERHARDRSGLAGAGPVAPAAVNGTDERRAYRPGYEIVAERILELIAEVRL